MSLQTRRLDPPLALVQVPVRRRKSAPPSVCPSRSEATAGSSPNCHERAGGVTEQVERETVEH